MIPIKKKVPYTLKHTRNPVSVTWLVCLFACLLCLCDSLGWQPWNLMIITAFKTIKEYEF